METSSYRMVLVMRALSKITQMQGRSGNELIITRAPILYRGEVVQIPAVSSNSLRHSAVREPGGMWLIENYGLYGFLKKEMLRLLVNGGNNATKSGGAESLSQFLAMKEALPLLGLMGCGLPDGPKEGRLKVSDAVVVCQEARWRLVDVAPELDLPEWLPPARKCVSKWTNYRHDNTHKRPDLLADPRESEDESKLHSEMPYGGEAIVPGALLVSEIHIEDATAVEVGAFLWSLRLWQGRGGFVGGMSAKGNGRTSAMLIADDFDLNEVANEYIDYANNSRVAAVDWLNATFSPPEKKAAKGKKKAEVIA